MKASKFYVILALIVDILCILYMTLVNNVTFVLSVGVQFGFVLGLHCKWILLF